MAIQKETKEKMLAEAAERLRILHDMGFSEELAMNGKNPEVFFLLNNSEPTWMNLDPEEQKKINEIKENFENKFDTVVFMGIKRSFLNETMLSFLYVDKYKQEWKDQKNYLMSRTHD